MIRHENLYVTAEQATLLERIGAIHTAADCRTFIGAVYRAFAQFTDEEGRPVMPAPRAVLVHASRMSPEDVGACEAAIATARRLNPAAWLAAETEAP